MPSVRIECFHGHERTLVDKVRGVTERSDIGDGLFQLEPGMAFFKFDLQDRSAARDGVARARENLCLRSLDIDLDEADIV